MFWLKENIELLKLVGAAGLFLFGIFYVPSALEDTKLKQSVCETIISNMEVLTLQDGNMKRDVSIYGLWYTLKSRALDNDDGKMLFDNLCYSILGDYNHAGDASGIMRALKWSDVDTAPHAEKLSRFALVIDGVDVHGGIDAWVTDASKSCENVKIRVSNLREISQHIKAALVHYSRIIYILKNRSNVVGQRVGQEEVSDLVRKLKRAVVFRNVAVVVDDTPKWIDRCEIRFYYEKDREFSEGIGRAVGAVLQHATGSDVLCVVNDYTLNSQGLLLPPGVVEVTVPYPPRDYMRFLSRTGGQLCIEP